MYHYFVRFSIFHKVTGTLMSVGRIEIPLNDEISQISQIEEIEKTVEEEFLVDINYSVPSELCNVLVDFYTLLRKEPD